MSFEERGVWTQMIGTAGAYLVYVAIVVPRLFDRPADDVTYLLPLLGTALASVLIAMVVRSALEFARPSESGTADQRDRDIARFGEHSSRWCVLGGAVAGLIGASSHWDYFWIANVIYLGLVLA
ncbi:MAG TPA: hypothetical protein VGJ28_26655, partial [Micromonosporaceae bacterium]